jgi:micrococcal nuclease
MTLAEAAARYEPCKICKPPVPTAVPPHTATRAAAHCHPSGAARTERRGGSARPFREVPRYDQERHAVFTQCPGGQQLLLATRAMRSRALAIALAALSCTAPLLGQERFSGSVVGITDGDTISVLRDGRAVRVRLDGIDCRESGQDFGQRAKQFTLQLTFAKNVSVEVRDIDRYGRLVGRVFADRQDVSLAIVRAGFAWHYKQYSSDPALAMAEVDARTRRAGLWSHANPIAPWEFRHPVRMAAPENSGPFHGNRRSGVFHRPGCPNYAARTAFSSSTALTSP